MNGRNNVDAHREISRPRFFGTLPDDSSERNGALKCGHRRGGGGLLICLAILAAWATPLFAQQETPASAGSGHSLETVRNRLAATLESEGFSGPFDVKYDGAGVLRVNLAAGAGRRVTSKRGLVEVMILASEAAVHGRLACRAVEVSSDTGMAETILVRAEAADLDALFNKKLAAGEFFGRVAFERQPWKPAETDPGRRAQEYHRRGEAILADGGSLDTALPLFRAAVDSDPKSVECLDTLAYSLSRQGDFGGAAQRFEELARLEPAKPEYHEQLMTCYIRMSRYADAIEAGTRALDAIKPLPAERKLGVLYGMAYGMFGAKRHPDAEQVMRKYMEVTHKPSANACWLLATVLIAQDKMKEAAEWARDAVRLDPEDATNQRTLGAALAELGEYQEAIAAYERYRELLKSAGRQPEDWVFVSLSFCHAKRGDMKRANDVAAQGLQVHPDAEDLKRNYRATYAEMLKRK